MPAGIEDRDADVWEPLLAVADAAGGDWPSGPVLRLLRLLRILRRAHLASASGCSPTCATVFGDADVLAHRDLLTALPKLDEAPWSDLQGKPLNARGLAQRLRQYGVKSTNVRIGDWTAGLQREDLWDAWSRYLPSTEPKSVKSEQSREGVEGPHCGLPSAHKSATSATSATSQVTGSVGIGLPMVRGPHPDRSALLHPSAC